MNGRVGFDEKGETLAFWKGDKVMDSNSGFLPSPLPPLALEQRAADVGISSPAKLAQAKRQGCSSTKWQPGETTVCIPEAEVRLAGKGPEP